jgi:hypothetical protein
VVRPFYSSENARIAPLFLIVSGEKIRTLCFYVRSSATAHYAKVYAMLTDYSTLDVALFTEREAAAKWLKVSVEVLMAQR